MFGFIKIDRRARRISLQLVGMSRFHEDGADGQATFLMGCSQMTVKNPLSIAFLHFFSALLLCLHLLLLHFYFSDCLHLHFLIPPFNSTSTSTSTPQLLHSCHAVVKYSASCLYITHSSVTAGEMMIWHNPCRHSKATASI